MFNMPFYKHPKYRAWIKSSSKMVEVREINYAFNWIWYKDPITAIITNVKFDDCILMPLTDYQDANDEEIYVGDVVKGTYYKKGISHRHIGFVDTRMKVLGLKQYTWQSDDLCRNYVKIGNVYENPELVSDDKFTDKYSEQN